MTPSIARGHVVSEKDLAARTKRLRKDPRCTLFAFDPGWSWLALETTVRRLEGPDAPDLSLRLFLKLMADEGRLVYEFDVERTYGMH